MSYKAKPVGQGPLRQGVKSTDYACSQCAECVWSGPTGFQGEFQYHCKNGFTDTAAQISREKGPQIVCKRFKSQAETEAEALKEKELRAEQKAAAEKRRQENAEKKQGAKDAKLAKRQMADLEEDGTGFLEYLEDGISSKNWVVLFVLYLSLGLLGIHRLYAGKKKWQVIVYMFTGGIWWIVDTVLILSDKFTDGDGYYIKPGFWGKIIKFLYKCFLILGLGVTIYAVITAILSGS
jgi:hypothetical protein